MSHRKQCCNEQPNCEWWQRTFFGPPGAPHHYMCTLPSERYRTECPIIKRAEVEEKLEEMVKVKCCDKCDAYEPFCRDVRPLYKFEYEQLCRKDERGKVLDELKKDLQTRFISSSNQWSKGRNSGLIECCNIIDELLRQNVGEP